MKRDTVWESVRLPKLILIWRAIAERQRLPCCRIMPSVAPLTSRKILLLEPERFPMTLPSNPQTMAAWSRSNLVQSQVNRFGSGKLGGEFPNTQFGCFIHFFLLHSLLEL